MNILIINHYAGSPEMGMEFRPYYFAREWIKMGHRVDIIAADYSHIRRKNPEISKDFEEQVIDDIHYHWIKTGDYEGNGVKRALTIAKFVSALWMNSKKIIKEIEPDVVICSSTYPVDTYVGQRIRKKSGKPVTLIHEVHDMWPASLIDLGGMSESHPFVKVMQVGENSFCRKSDVVVSLLPAAKDHFIEHGMMPEKFVHVSNGVILKEWENPEPLEADIAAHFRRKKEEGKLNLCFFGSIHKTYNLDTLIDAMIKRGKDDVALTFIGPGMDKEELKKMTVGREDMFAFFDPIPKKQVPSIFEHVDGTFIGIKNQKISRFGISMNKLFDSMMGGKPIIYMVQAPNNHIEEYDCGIIVNGTDENAIIAAIDEFASLPEERRREMGANGNRAAREVFNYNSLAEKFAGTFGK